MKTEKKILIAFLMNLCFSAFEFVGGVLTGSVAIMSDALHDFGDAISIGVAWLLERKSKQEPDECYTYGYGRYSVLGGLLTTAILIFGSVVVTCRAVGRILHPVPVHYDGMILFALVGVVLNGLAAYLTREGESLNRKAVNLHLLEDVLGWVVVLIGAVVMRLTDFVILDPILSIAVAVFILFHSFKNLKEVLEVFLEKTPRQVNIRQIKARISGLEGVQEVHHLHLWSLDGQHHYATMHIVTGGDPHTVKHRIRRELTAQGITHVTLELETPEEDCHQRHCHITSPNPPGHHHHHHH